MGAAMQGMGGQMGMGAPGAGTKPTIRNPIMTYAIPLGCMVILPTIFNIIASVAGIGLIGLIGSLAALAGLVIWYINIIKMTNELKSVTGNQAFSWFPYIIPVYNIIWTFSVLPQEMQKAKQMRGVQTPARSGILYFLFTPIAFASDLNDIAKASP